MADLTAAKKAKVTQACSRAKPQGHKPAIVFDADTNLWTYDMEDAVTSSAT